MNQNNNAYGAAGVVSMSQVWDNSISDFGLDSSKSAEGTERYNRSKCFTPRANQDRPKLV